MTVRTRFAPSPTGDLHIGGVRTALFSYLYARRHEGTFILRVEDTDRERSTPESLQVILDGMAWLGLAEDEGPYYQTERFDRYAEVLEQLIEDGGAYRCYCTREELAERREQQLARKENPRYDGRCRERTEPREGVDPVVRFRNPREGEVVIDDLVQGRVVYSNEELDDLIIARSDGSPTYNFTVVVDDIDMQVTHVIRGDDHLNNTPKQMNIMRALGWEPPAYAHVPMILGADGAKLSKRHGAVSVLAYREDGYLPEALLNYLVRLGWSRGDQEVFSMAEMIEAFDIADVNKAASAFNPDKLLWLNQHYIKTLDPAHVAVSLAEQYERLGVDTSDGPALDKVVVLYRERARTLVDMAQSSLYLYRDVGEYDAKAARKHMKGAARPILEWLLAGLEKLTDWEAEPIDALVQAAMAAHDVKMGAVAQPLRIAVTGGNVSPGMGATLYTLGRTRTLERVARAIEWLDAREQDA